MRVELVSVTAPVRDMTAEQLIVYCARVSAPQNQADTSNTRLINYLIRHRHWSPFEMVNMCVEIETSRAIAAQILRHRSFSFQEFSQRYADASQLGFEPVQPRRQDTKDRQNSTDDLAQPVADWFAYNMRDTEQIAMDRYKRALDMGIAKETARFLLPLNTTTRLYMSGTVRSFLHYLQVRAFDGAGKTQREHKDVALAVYDIFKAQFPLTAAAAFEGAQDG